MKQRGAAPSGGSGKVGKPNAEPAKLSAHDERLLWAQAEQIIEDVISMSDDEIADYLGEHGLSHLATPDYIDGILAQAAAAAAKGKSSSEIPGAVASDDEKAINRQIDTAIKGPGVILAN